MVVDSPWHRVAGCIRTKSTLGKLRKPWELSSTFGKYKEWLIPVDPAAGEDMLPQTTKGGGAFGFKGDDIVPYEEIRFDPSVQVGTDGTAVDALYPILARAVWAAIQYNEAARQWQGVAGPVPPHRPQWASEAEQLAPQHAAARGARKMVTDCMAVYLAGVQHPSKHIAPTRVHAGTWRTIRTYGGALDNLDKVQAHQGVPEQPISKEEWDIVINDKADSWAKRANEEHIVPAQIADDYRMGLWACKKVFVWRWANC